MVRCVDCGKEIHKDRIVSCDMCGTPLREECGTTGLCSTCIELWESEIDLEDMKAEEEWQKQEMSFAGYHRST